MRFGLDSTSMVPIDAQRAIGSTVAIRYLSRATEKVITKSEHEALKAAKIDLYLVFEDGGRPDLSDFAGGAADAEFALGQALGILGKPERPPHIAFAWDNDPSGDVTAADGYYEGVASRMGMIRSGPYGGYPATRHLGDKGFRNIFQTYAWSGGQFDDRSKVFQYSNDHTVGGVGVDFDKIFPDKNGDFGQYDFKVVPPNPNDIFPTDIGDKHFPNKGNERLTVEQAKGALEHPEKYRGYLKGKMYYELKSFRDRLYRIAKFEPPDYTKPRKTAEWGPNSRGERWQELDNLMNKIARI